MGMTCGFYQLRMVSNDTTVLVPVENADSVGLRKAVGNSEDRPAVLRSSATARSTRIQNWKGRFKDNSDRMRTGSLFDVVEVLKSLTYLSRSKNLSFREKRMLDRAKFLVISEIAEVTHEDLPIVEVSASRTRSSVRARRRTARWRGRPRPRPPRSRRRPRSPAWPSPPWVPSRRARVVVAPFLAVRFLGPHPEARARSASSPDGPFAYHDGPRRACGLAAALLRRRPRSP